MRAVVQLVAWVAAVALAAPAARAEPKVVHKKMWFAEKDGSLVVSTSFTEDLFDEKAYAALSSGFETNVAIRGYVYKLGDEFPIASTAATFRLVYDLWDEEYDVQVIDRRGTVNWTFGARADALRAISEIHELPLASLRRVPVGSTYYCVFLVELNPVSAETLAEMRRWLTRGAGKGLDGTSSLFGSVVSVFVNPKLDEADAAVRVISQPFYRVERKR